MKRLQFTIDAELDVALGQLAEREGVSKSALVRRIIAERLPPLSPRAAASVEGVESIDQPIKHDE